jgi:pimeloyl-ACP methyl ester carboxylesterase
MGRLVDRLERSTARSGRQAVVIGHSRGGVFARALAVRRPDLISGIVTLGSPLVDPLRNVHPLLHLQLELMSSLGDLGLGRVLSHTCADRQLFDEVPVHPLSRALLRRARRRHEAAEAAGEVCCTEFWKDFRAPFPADDVRFVSIYSRTDGIVHYEACLDPAAEHVEVASTHCGMAASAPVYTRVAKVLADMTVHDTDRLAA